MNSDIRTLKTQHQSTNIRFCSVELNV